MRNKIAIALGLLFAIASTTAASTVNFAWNASTGQVDGYRLYESTNAGTSFFAVLTTTNLFASVTNIVQGTNYQFRVTAFNVDVESLPSNTLNVRVPFAAPTAPGGLSTTVISATRIDLNWRDMASNENGFKLERKKGGDVVFALVATLPPNTVSYIDNTLKPRRSYCYRLLAFNDEGNSPYAGPACDRTNRN